MYGDLGPAYAIHCRCLQQWKCRVPRGAARIMSGYQGPEDLVSPTLRSWAAKKGKEEVELAAARAKIRDYKKISTPTDEAAAAVSDGNLPAGGVPAKPKRKAKARLAPPAAT